MPPGYQRGVNSPAGRVERKGEEASRREIRKRNLGRNPVLGNAGFDSACRELVGADPALLMGSNRKASEFDESAMGALHAHSRGFLYSRLVALAFVVCQLRFDGGKLLVSGTHRQPKQNKHLL